MDQFDQLLTCAICLDRYRNPKLLPCQHSFCMEPCMEGLVDYIKRQVKCPECRQECRVPYQGVQAFPTNVTLQRFLELHIDMTGELPDPTANQVMERCQVCSEKSYCVNCTHCDKKVCTECKDAHMDVLKREISRISNQVRRVLHRLEDALSLGEKNAIHLQQNSLNVIEEIDDIYRRLSKALKDRAEGLKQEVERYLQTEVRSLSQFKHNIEQELTNIQSNCDLVDKYMQAESTSTVWDDCELMDTKDIFLKTMEFIRNFEYEPGDYARRVRFMVGQDPNTLAVTLATYGDLHLPPSNLGGIGSSGGGGSSAPGSNTLSTHQSGNQSGLMRSKSDHRLTTQFRGQDYEDSSGGRTSPVFGRKFGERKPESSNSNSSRANQYQYDEPTALETPERKTRFRSRFIRHLDTSFDDQQDAQSRVRFTDDDARRERERVLDTEDVTRGPLSGITKLLDCPRVIQRVQETDMGPRAPKLAPAAPVKVQTVIIKEKTPTPCPPAAPVAPWRSTSRQVSEEDEITKQKKANKEPAATSTSAAVQPVKPTPAQPSAVRRQPSSEPKSPQDRNFSRTSSESSAVGIDGVQLTSGGETPSSGAGTQGDSSGRGPRKLSPERFPKNRSESSDSGTSETSSGSSSGRTGAVFSTEEVKQRFLNKAATSQEKDTNSGRITPQKKENPATITTTAITSTATAGGRPKFQSRFLTRTQTPTVETKEESSSSSEEESESEEDEVPVKAAPEPIRSRMEKTDIGPLLARSSNARDTSRDAHSNANAYKKEPVAPSTVSSYRRTRDAHVTRVTSPPERDVYTSRAANAGTTAPSSNSNYGSRYSSSNYGGGGGGGGDYGSSASSTTSGLTRSRTGTSLYSTTPPKETATTSSRYSSGLANKYLNKSRHTFDDDLSLSSSSPTASRYTSSTPSSYSRPSYLSKQEASRGGSGRGSASKLGNGKTERERRRERLAKSKSSHEVLGGLGSSGSYEEDEDVPKPKGPVPEPITSGRNSTNRRKSTSTTGEIVPSNDDSASLSSWARYLKNKYGKGQQQRSQSATNSQKRGSLGGESSCSDAEIATGPERPRLNTGLTTPGGNHYMNKKILQFKFGSRGSDPGFFTWPRDVSVAADGSIVVTDSSNHRIQVFNEFGNFIKEFGSYGNSEGEFDCPAGVVVNRIGQYIISDRYNHRIVVLDPSGRFLRAFGSQGSSDGRFNYPWGVCCDALGFIYVVDKENSRVQVFNCNGEVVGKFGSLGSKPGEFNHPHYIAVTSTNRVIVSDTNNHRIQIFDVNGRFMSSIGCEGSEEGQFKLPRGISLDETFGNIIVGDSGNNRIQIFTPDGVFLHSFGSWGCGDSEFKGMEGIAVTGNGNILVVDREQHCVKCF